MKTYNAYINGEFTNGNDFIEIISPFDDSVAGKVSAISKEEIDRAFTSAKIAFKDWRKKSTNDRKQYLLKFTELLNINKEELAEIINSETGKAVKDAIVEIERTIEYINETIKVWDQISYSSIELPNKKANLDRVPLGVVLAISPFNYPVNLSLSKIAPALLTGNTVVFKPATNGSLTGGFIAKLMHETGLPKGVFNLTTGRGREIGDALVEHKDISMISFTGGVKVGKGIAEKNHLIPLVLELGGNDAGYVRNDADIEMAVNEVAKGAFSFSGQRCTAIKRLILHKDIADEFLAKLNNKVTSMELGPVISNSSANYIRELIKDSRDRNDKFILEGNTEGNYIDAHIMITDSKSRTWNEEAFGPILPVVIIENEDNLVELINDTNFGLQNSLFTSDIEWAKNISYDIESGTVNINRSSSRGPDIFPFLGVKDSGFGVQGVEYALISMTRFLNTVENK